MPNPTKRTVRLLALVIAFLAFQAYWFVRETPTEARLGEIAAKVAGREAPVRCPSIWKRLLDISVNAGAAHVPPEGERFAELKHEYCETFDGLLDDGFPEDVDCLRHATSACDERVHDVVLAVHLLSHEAQHLRGVLDEAAADCYAFQTDALVAEELGATPEQARLVAAHLAATIPAITPDRYHSDQCFPGGALDLHPETPSWPTG